MLLLLQKAEKKYCCKNSACRVKLAGVREKTTEVIMLCSPSGCQEKF
jgi:hypothetical protein